MWVSCNDYLLLSRIGDSSGCLVLGRTQRSRCSIYVYQDLAHVVSNSTIGAWKCYHIETNEHLSLLSEAVACIWTKLANQRAIHDATRGPQHLVRCGVPAQEVRRDLHREYM